MRPRIDSPIRETLDTWPLAGVHQMRWGGGHEGNLWVTVEGREGRCEAALPYHTYLEMVGWQRLSSEHNPAERMNDE